MTRAQRRRLGLVSSMLVASLGLPGDAVAVHLLMPPEITSPADGSLVCAVDQGLVSFSGRAQLGTQQIQIHDSGMRLGDHWVDGTTWAGESWVPAGHRTITAVGYSSVAGTEHTSDASAPVSLEVFDASSAIREVFVSPGTFSPADHNGVKDSVRLSVYVAVSGTVVFKVFRGNVPIDESPPLPSPGGSKTIWWWDGRGSEAINGGAFVPSGVYRVEAYWTGRGCNFVRDGVEVTVDNVRPAVYGMADSPPTFYPREDDDLVEFKDTMRVAYGGLSEPATVTLNIYKSDSNTVVRAVKGRYGDEGGGYVIWNGRRANRTLLPAGTYEYALKLVDRVGNTRVTGRGHTVSSNKRLDARVTTISKRGDAYEDADKGGCGSVSTSLSDWPEGVRLSARNCSSDWADPDVASVVYVMTSPAADYYHSFTLAGYGYSPRGDELLGGLYDFQSDYIGFSSIGGKTPARRTFGPVYGSRHRGPGGNVVAALALLSLCDCANVTYDVRYVYLKAVYGVLVSP